MFASSSEVCVDCQDDFFVREPESSSFEAYETEREDYVMRFRIKSAVITKFCEE